MNSGFSVIDVNGIKLISVDCINRTGKFKAYYSTGIGGASDMPGNFTMNLSMFKRCANDTFEKVMTNFQLFADCCGFPIESISLHREVHENRTVAVSREDLPDDVFDRSAYEEADGQVTSDDRVSLFVYAGDCCTIMMADPQSGVFGTVHCGWKNSVNGTIPEFVRMFREQGGDVGSAIAAIGPSICREHYDLDMKSAEQFYKLGFGPDLEYDIEKNRWKVDLPAINRKLLQTEGVPEDSIYTAPWCTYEGGELCLPSYRRDKGLNGMMGGVIFRS